MMTSHAMLGLAVCLFSLHVSLLAEASVFEVDLLRGLASPTLPDGIQWHETLSENRKDNCTCDRNGVLKLTFDLTTRVRAEINMTFSHSEGFTFNVADSVSCNGHAGDGNDQDNDAEVHPVGNTMYFQGRDKSYGVSYGRLYKRQNFVAVRPYRNDIPAECVGEQPVTGCSDKNFTSLTLNIADNLATVYNGHDYLHLNTHKLFALRGQEDKARGGVNYDVYLAMNRVVQMTYGRLGSGLCKVQVKFYPAV